MDGLKGCAVITLAMPIHVCVGVDDKEAGGKVGSNELRVVFDVLGGWGRAGLILFRGRTSEGVTTEQSSAGSLAAGAVNCCTFLNIVQCYGSVRNCTTRLQALKY
jgi:hypothetical protein